MSNIPATLRRPSGFGDVEAFKSTVTIIGFVWGKSTDVGRYSDSREECALAIIVSEHGLLSTAPIANLTIEPS